MNLRLLYSNKYYALAFLWAAFILFATLASGHALRHFNILDIFAYDKPIHATLFGAQAWFLIKGRIRSPYNNYMNIVLYACIFSTLYGVLTEILQGVFVMQGRSFDVMDMLGDAVGCAIVYIWFRWRRKQFAQ